MNIQLVKLENAYGCPFDTVDGMYVKAPFIDTLSSQKSEV